MFKHCHGPDNVLNLPLTTLKKEYDSDDEIDDSCCIRPKRRHSLDDMTRRIKFNEELVICYYRPREPPTAL